MKYLNMDDVRRLTDLARSAAERRVPGFFEWKNPPRLQGEQVTHDEKHISLEESFQIWKDKLDCAYAQRFLLLLAFVVSAVKSGMKVAVIQFKEREETAFDPEGWVTFSFDGFTNFHVSPEDLPLQGLQDAGLVNLLAPDSEEGKKHGYHGRNKLQRLFLPIEQLLDTGASSCID